MDENSSDSELNRILEIVRRFGTHQLPMWYVNLLIFRSSNTICSKLDLEKWSSENDLSCEFELRPRQSGKRVRGQEEFVVFTCRTQMSHPQNTP
jgi:hypothetical protein